MHPSISYPEWQKILQEGAACFGGPLSERQIRLLYRHGQMLQRWNRTTNLTAIRDPRMMALKHFVDSFGAARHFTPVGRVLDVGSGGGFPGLPLKIVCPSIELTMVDAARKKVSFLQHVIRELELKGARAVQARVEELARQADAPFHYDTIVCRAFGSLASIVAQLPPLLSERGRIVVWKGRLPHEEIREVEPVLSTVKRALTLSVQSYRLPITEAERTLVILSAGGHDPKEPRP